jgi:type II secretory pathway predicted ATPase ExeA
MFIEAFGFSAPPFSLTPDPRFFFASASHQKALAHLWFGLSHHEGFVVLVGEPGTGKTALVHHILENVDPGTFVVGGMFGGRFAGDDMVRMTAAALGLGFEGTDKASLLGVIEEAVAEHHQRGLHTVLVIDEAQDLDDSALEELRLLSNVQQGYRSGLQIVLLGQPALRQTLARPRFLSLRQRVVAACQLSPMDDGDTAEYVGHRMGVAGWTGVPEFTDDALRQLHAETGGNPRRINLLASRLLVAAALDDVSQIDRRLVDLTARDLEEELSQAIAPAGETPCAA